MELLYYGKDVNECLERAAKELNISKSEINYKVVKKSRLLRKDAAIKVKINQDNNEKKNDNLISDNNENIVVEKEQEENLCGIAVKNKEIIIIPSDNAEEKFSIRTCKGINLFINNVLCNKGEIYNISQYDEIRYTSEKTDSDRRLSIRISNDKMSVYGKAEYIPEYSYELKDSQVKKNINLKSERVVVNESDKYKVDDVVAELKKLKVSYGILYDEIIKLCEGTSETEIIIAKGKKPIDDVPDKINIFFDNNVIKKVDENETIDYRNRYSFTCVEKNEVIAERIPGKTGENGQDVFGKVVKRNIIRNKPFKAGKGCNLEENKICASDKGMPSVQNGIFTVNPIYTVKDVNMKTGNINFGGNVEVNGSVTEGMEVSCKGMLVIKKDVSSAKIKANNNIEVNGNIINSTVLAGGYDIEKKTYLDMLKDYYEGIDGLVLSLDKMTQTDKSRKIGQLMQILIDNRYKEIPKMSLEILTYNLKSGIRNEDILNFIRNKMIGLNAFKIESMTELYDFRNLVHDELDYLGDECEIPVDVKASYIQNSNIVCTGNILVEGKGSYVSSLRAFDTIEFTNPASVVRGGVLSSKKSLKLMNVGSEGGVITKLQVDEKGVIEAKTAYNGTIFCFGHRQKMLSESGRNVKAFLGEDRQIVIEKLKLDK